MKLCGKCCMFMVGHTCNWPMKFTRLCVLDPCQASAAERQVNKAAVHSYS
jgi:hypothetical protein